MPKSVSLVLPFGNKVMLTDDAEAVKTIYKAEFLANVHTQRDGTGRIMGGGMPVNRIYKNWQSWLMNDMCVFVSTLGTSDVLKRLAYVATQNNKAPRAMAPAIDHSPDIPGGLPFELDGFKGPAGPSRSMMPGMPSVNLTKAALGTAAAAATGYAAYRAYKAYKGIPFLNLSKSAKECFQKDLKYLNERLGKLKKRKEELKEKSNRSDKENKELKRLEAVKTAVEKIRFNFDNSNTIDTQQDMKTIIDNIEKVEKMIKELKGGSAASDKFKDLVEKKCKIIFSKKHINNNVNLMKLLLHIGIVSINEQINNILSNDESSEEKIKEQICKAIYKTWNMYNKTHHGMNALEK